MQRRRGGTAATKARRDAILGAALELFNTVGYARTTMRAVQERAGASTGSLYHHFPTKEALAAALYVEGIRNAQRSRLRALARASTPRDGVRAFVGDYLRWCASHRRLAEYLLNTRHAEFMSPAEAQLQELNRGFIGAVADWMRPHVEKGDLPALPADIGAAIVTGPSDHFARQWLRGQTRTSLARASELIAEITWYALHETARTQRRRIAG